MLVQVAVSAMFTSQCWLNVESGGGLLPLASLGRFSLLAGSDHFLSDLSVGEYLFAFECGLSKLAIPVNVVEGQSLIDLGEIEVPLMHVLSRWETPSSVSPSMRDWLILLTCSLSVLEVGLIVVAFPTK